MPQIGIVHEASDLLQALDCRFDCHPSVVLVDGDLAYGEIYPAVRQVKVAWPEAACVFMIDDVHQQEEAEAAGADLVLLKGFPAAGLTALIAGRLLRKLAEQPGHDGSLQR